MGARCSISTGYSATCTSPLAFSRAIYKAPPFLGSLTDWATIGNSRRLPRSLANMRAVLSHYQTLLNDYRTPGGSFADIMCTAPHRGFLEDHRFVDPTYGCGVTLP